MHLPFLFWGARKIVSPFIDKTTREKVPIFCNQFQLYLRRLLEWNTKTIVLAVCKFYLPYFQVVLVDDADVEKQLLEEMDRDQIPKIYDGNMELVPIQDA